MPTPYPPSVEHTTHVDFDGTYWYWWCSARDVDPISFEGTGFASRTDALGAARDHESAKKGN